MLGMGRQAPRWTAQLIQLRVDSLAVWFEKLFFAEQSTFAVEFQPGLAYANIHPHPDAIKARSSL
jgi:hypothetical protein